MKGLKHNWVTGVIFIACFIFMFHVGFADDTCIIETDDGPYTFTAPVVPVSRTTSSNRVYLAFFYPGEENFWAGNVIKFGINEDNQIVDALYDPDEPEHSDPESPYNRLSLDPNGAIREDAVPFWATIDWADPTKSNYIHNSNRNIYTYLGSFRDLTDLTNEFKPTNDRLTEEILGNPANHTTAQLIDFVRGADVNGQNRDVITGDVLHSEPLVIDYEDSLRVVYFGANDGMLHAVKDSTLSTPASDDGREMWAFIPPDQLHRLKDMVEGESHQYYVDSSPKVYIKDVNGNGIIEVNVDSDGDDDVDDDDKDQAILVCGERKGGTSYFALDVTNPERPFFLWRISQYDDAYNNVAIVFCKQGDYDNALHYLDKAIALIKDIKPSHADVFNNLGFVYMKKGMHKESAGAYNYSSHIIQSKTADYSDDYNQIAFDQRIDGHPVTAKFYEK